MSRRPHWNPVVFWCEHCRKNVHPKNHIINDLRGEKFATIGALCRYCISPLTKTYTNKHRIALPDSIKRRQLECSAEEYKTKHRIIWPEFMDEQTAEKYCGYKKGAFRSLRKLGIAPTVHCIGYYTYWQADLDEWLKQKERR